MRKPQEIKVVLHFPRQVFDMDRWARHAIAVKELIDLDITGKLEGNLTTRIRLLDEVDEDAAWERYIKRHPIPKKNN